MSMRKLTVFFLITLTSLIMCRDEEETIYYSKDTHKYQYGDTNNCDQFNCPEPNYCSEDKKQCICGQGQANYPFVGENGQYCQYKQYKQLVAFLWELLLNLGIGHFYIKDIIIGVLKMIIMIIL